jgi:hypothetical protein
MAAEFEEVVVDTDSLHSQYLRPDSRQHSFRFRPLITSLHELRDVL